MLLDYIYGDLLTESVSVNEIDDAIDNHKRVIINYHSRGEDVATGARVIEVYAYGLTKAGNPVIRAFQPFGDTTSKVPSWKFFRLDRISDWKETKQTFSRPASEYYKGLGEFNPNGDLTMSVVYKIAKFDDEDEEMDDFITKTNPKLKQSVFKTDTEKNMERLRQQVTNPIKLSDLKLQNGFKNTPEPNKETGPKLKPQPIKQEPEVYKTDTERGLEKLRQQLNNPKKIDLDNFNKPRKNKPSEEELADLRQRLGDTSDRMTLKDLNDRLSGNKENNQLYKTDTERGLERLKQQLNNPKKIDLDKIPKR